MDWKMFFGGVSMLLMAVFFRFLVWTYRKDEVGSDYNYYQRLKNWAGVIVCIIGGLFVVFCSLAPKS